MSTSGPTHDDPALASAATSIRSGTFTPSSPGADCLETGGAVGASADVSELRSRRLLRLLAESTRLASRCGVRAPAAVVL